MSCCYKTTDTFKTPNTHSKKTLVKQMQDFKIVPNQNELCTNLCILS